MCQAETIMHNSFVPFCHESLTDRMELYYHTGIATRTLARFSYPNPVLWHADVITAALLIGVCMDEYLELSKVELNSEAAIEWLHNFLPLKEVELNDKWSLYQIRGTAPLQHWNGELIELILQFVKALENIKIHLVVWYWKDNSISYPFCIVFSAAIIVIFINIFMNQCCIPHVIRNILLTQQLVRSELFTQQITLFWSCVW